MMSPGISRQEFPASERASCSLESHWLPPKQKRHYCSTVHICQTSRDCSPQNLKIPRTLDSLTFLPWWLALHLMLLWELDLWNVLPPQFQLNSPKSFVWSVCPPQRQGLTFKFWEAMQLSPDGERVGGHNKNWKLGPLHTFKIDALFHEIQHSFVVLVVSKKK